MFAFIAGVTCSFIQFFDDFTDNDSCALRKLWIVFMPCKDRSAHTSSRAILGVLLFMYGLASLKSLFILSINAVVISFPIPSSLITSSAFFLVFPNKVYVKNLLLFLSNLVLLITPVIGFLLCFPRYFTTNFCSLHSHRLQQGLSFLYICSVS